MKVVLLDTFGKAEDVASVLDGTGAEVVRAADVPSGPGVVALLLGPETPLTADQVRALPDLRIVAATSAGHDHVPVDAVARQGAWVTTSAGYCTDEVADHTIALVTGLVRGVVALDRSVRAGRWDVTEAAPRRIAGTVLGLAGLGRIGAAVATRATALGMEVRAYDPAAGAAAFARCGAVRARSLSELLGAADVVSLHAPATPATERMIDAAALAALRPGAFVVNVARGSLVDHGALAAALRSGRLAGAALDVLPAEPPRRDDPLLDCPNLIITPHAAWYSADALVRPFRQAAGQVAAVLAGRVPDAAVAGPRENVEEAP
ncbi:C-terminal binding protein [Spirillospora sp. NPDC047279]|uniref:C-terminal binding protein n=1 Tax=Spirillospora sp. NPDC047279 TaxID=3155478 RepID=UPI0033DC0496